MNSNNNTNTNDNNNDLKFVPLSIEEPFKSKIDRWIPFVNLSNKSTITDNIYLGLPPIYIDKELTRLDFTRQNRATELPRPTLLPNLPDTDDNFTPFRDNQFFTSETLTYNTFPNNDSLYCYNSPNEFSNNSLEAETLPTDILRMFDFSIELDDIEDCNRKPYNNLSDKVFQEIENNNPSILGAMKAYKIPSPIAGLLVKRVIKITLNYLDRE